MANRMGAGAVIKFAEQDVVAEVRKRSPLGAHAFRTFLPRPPRSRSPPSRG
jgi:hypothetical protein